MKLLEEQIRKDGEVLGGDVLKADSFLNRQIDPELMIQVGAEFKRLFGDEKITKVLTCEASEIAPGIMAAYQLGVPMAFVRRKKPSTLNDVVCQIDIFSYTKEINNKICVEEKFLSSDGHLLIINDFLARGEAARGMLNIVKQVDASVAGVSVVVAKEFQGGNGWVKEYGYRLEALAKIASFENNQIYFVGEK